MNSAYHNNGHAPRYQCGNMKSTYDEPLCQSLSAAPLDRLIADLVLAAVQPAAIEVSLAVAADVEAERAALERNWRQSLERAAYVVQRAHRQYQAVEPENRLVARTLERAWEEALADQARLQADYERRRREQPAAPSLEEIAAIQAVAQDLPALWRAETTTKMTSDHSASAPGSHSDRSIDGTEQVRVECHWHGGVRTQHWVIRRSPTPRPSAPTPHWSLGRRNFATRARQHQNRDHLEPRGLAAGQAMRCVQLIHGPPPSLQRRSPSCSAPAALPQGASRTG